MQAFFKTIVIPVDFTLNTEVAINKALEVADVNEAVIHLVHVYNSTLLNGIVNEVRNLFPFKKYMNKAEAEKMLKQWKGSIEEQLVSAKVCVWMLPSVSIQDAISRKAKELQADLIVIGRKSNHNWLPIMSRLMPDTLTKETGSAVLTVKPGSLHKKIKKVVVPITDNLPEQKMEAIAALCKKNKVNIYLVTFMDEKNGHENFSASSLLKMYQWLKTSFHCQTEYAVLHGYDKAKAILRYTQKINADILLVYAETESKIGWSNKHISDVLPSASKVRILTVWPVTSFN